MSMQYVSKHLLEKLEKEEEDRIIREYQETMETSGLLSNPERLWLRRFRRPLRDIGGVLLGMLIGTFAVFLTFILLNLVLHVT